MKNCPNCHAEIEDNARFCVFCMSSLQEKETITTKKDADKRWLYIAAVFLLIVLILLFVILFGNKKHNNHDDDNSSFSGIAASINSTDSSAAASSDDVSDDSSDDSGNPPSSVPENNDGTIEDGNSNDTTTTPSTPSTPSTPNTPETPQKPDTPSTPTPSTPTPSTPTTPTTPPQDDTQNGETTPGEPPSDTIPEDDIENDVSIYEYRDAQKSDYTDYEIDNAIVITKVVSPTTDGVYVIPDKINGKTVVAIMDNAFGDENVKNTVKTVVIPATIRTIWGNAFFSCHNLTHLYIKGDGFYAYDNFFPPVQRRNATITIHSSTVCRDKKNGVKFSLIASYNNALFEVWDGEGF